MTIGIYILRFTGTDRVYIGQSIDIERRFAAHKRALKLNLASAKLQEAYNTYGLPQLDILIETSIEELNASEIEAISIFNSIANGFNTVDGGSYATTQVGELASNAKYTNAQYSRVLKLLATQLFSVSEIAEETGVSSSVVISIRKCENHRWLEELYPDEYKLLADRAKGYTHTSNNTAESRGIVYPMLVSPTGEEYEVKSLRGFAREHGLQSSNLERLLHGQGLSLKGWTVKGRPIPEYPKVVSPDGVEYIIEYGKASEFATTHGLNKGKLSELLNKKAKSHRGWTIKNNDDRV